MSVRFEIKMTPQTMYSFMLHHNYTHLTGILGVIFGAVTLVMGLKKAESGNTAMAVLLFFVTAFVLVYPPVMFWRRAKRETEELPAFQKIMFYELSDSGVKVIQGDQENENPWSDFRSAVSTGQALVLYMDKNRAVIFPRAQIGERWAAAAEIISTHMPPDKVRIRQVN